MAKVLVVDDDDDTREMLRILFAHEGCDVRTAESGTAAMKEYWKARDEGDPVKLVVMDLAMPDLDGVTTTAQLRAAEAGDPGAPRAFIYGYTGHGDKLHSRESLFRAGFDFVAVKPGDPADFKRMARKFTDGE